MDHKMDHKAHLETKNHSFTGHSHMVKDFKKRFWVCLVLTIPILILSPIIQHFLHFQNVIAFRGDQFVLFGFSTVVFLYGGYPFLKGFINELKTSRPGMMTLISVAILTAYLYSSAVVFGLKGEVFFWELATLIDVMLLGHWIEMKSVMGASKAIEELARIMPSKAHKLLPGGGITDVSLSQLLIKDKVVVKPGEKIPADGVVIDGESSVNEAMLTGESKPVLKKSGAVVIGGSINSEGSITVEVKKTGADSFISQVIKLVRQAQESKSKTQDLANVSAMWLTFIALLGGVITLIVWIVLKAGFTFAIGRAVTVMVITCPHALGLAVPLVIAVSTAISARNGLLIRNRSSFEKARNIQAIIFDKTGTLTEGRFGVTDILLLAKDISNEGLLSYAASIEARSEHPIAKGITLSAKKTFPVENFKAITGKGAQGKVNGREIKVVSSGYLKENRIIVSEKKTVEFAEQGKTVVYILINDELKGAIALADIIRPESYETILRLKDLGIKTMMLTGDNKKVAEHVARQLGLDEYFAEVLPHEKAKKVHEVQERGLTVAMTGDGINDAPALAQADVGIAIGAGTDVAIETADIILVKNNPLDVLSVIGLSASTYKKMVQNLIWATGYNVIAIPLAAGVLAGYGILLSPAVGAALMSISTVIVTINARFLKI
jgi:Cu2+-exporting ATPase